MTETPRSHIFAIAEEFARPVHHRGALPTGIRASMRRMSPERWSLRTAELLPVLVRSRIRVDALDPDSAARWAALVHLVAVLSGTSNERAHADRRRTGAVLLEAGYSEARLSRLLSARGAVLRIQVARLARFLRAKGGQPLDLRPLAELVLNEGRDEAKAEEARLIIARGYYAAADRAAREDAE